MRYIDADKLQLYLNDYAIQVSPSESDDEKTRKWNEIVYMTIDTCMKAVDEQPTADVRENVRGEWILHIDDLFPEESTMECNQCHEHQPVTIDDNFCPNCGADMRREDNGRDEENHNRV